METVVPQTGNRPKLQVERRTLPTLLTRSLPALRSFGGDQPVSTPTPATPSVRLEPRLPSPPVPTLPPTLRPKTVAFSEGLVGLRTGQPQATGVTVHVRQPVTGSTAPVPTLRQQSGQPVGVPQLRQPATSTSSLPTLRSTGPVTDSRLPTLHRSTDRPSDRPMELRRQSSGSQLTTLTLRPNLPNVSPSASPRAQGPSAPERPLGHRPQGQTKVGPRSAGPLKHRDLY